MMRLALTGINPPSPRRIEQKTNVTDAVWLDVPQATFSSPAGNAVDAIVPLPNSATRFYRVVETP